MQVTICINSLTLLPFAYVKLNKNRLKALYCEQKSSSKTYNVEWTMNKMLKPSLRDKSKQYSLQRLATIEVNNLQYFIFSTQLNR